jgi:hypothetical protein
MCVHRDLQYGNSGSQRVLKTNFSNCMMMIMQQSTSVPDNDPRTQRNLIRRSDTPVNKDDSFQPTN